MSQLGKKNIIKLILLGDGAVGKTSLRRKFMGDSFKENYAMTIGADFSIKRIDSHLLQIYDLAGQPGFKMLRKHYYYGAQAAIIVYDVTKNQTLTNVRKWVSEMVMAIGTDIPTILVGNKIDLRTDGMPNSVSTDEGNKFAQSLDEEFTTRVFHEETSAKTGVNVDKMFSTIITHLTDKNDASPSTV